MPCLLLPGHDGSPAGRAQRVRIGLREAHRLRRKPVDVRRLIVLRTIGTAVGPSHVIDKEENDVGWRGFGLGVRGGAHRAEQGGDVYKFYFHGSLFFNAGTLDPTFRFKTLHFPDCIQRL